MARLHLSQFFSLLIPFGFAISLLECFKPRTPEPEGLFSDVFIGQLACSEDCIPNNVKVLQIYEDGSSTDYPQDIHEELLMGGPFFFIPRSVDGLSSPVLSIEVQVEVGGTYFPLVPRIPVSATNDVALASNKTILTGAGCRAFVPIFTYRFPVAAPFDPVAWREAEFDRYRVVEDLLLHHLSVGMTKDEVVELLGPPPSYERMTLPCPNLQYEIRRMPLDDLWLVILFESDMVTAAFISEL